jgi:hypothetical protein
MKRAEQSLYVDHESTDRTLSHFAKRQPVSIEGRLALARANLATGNTQAARDLVKNVWNDASLDAVFEKSIIAEFGSLLGTDDHKRRMWRMVYAQESNAAIRNSVMRNGALRTRVRSRKETQKCTHSRSRSLRSLECTARGPFQLF